MTHAEMTERQLRKIAAAAGATVEDDGEGTLRATAIAGHRWEAGLHELVEPYLALHADNYPKGQIRYAQRTGRARLAERIAEYGNTEPCTDAECDWCEEGNEPMKTTPTTTRNGPQDRGLGLNAAFRKMRSHGLIAKQRFMCCQGCAGAKIATDLIEAIEGGLDPDGIRGAVFYHRQAAENRDSGRPFYLNFGPVELYRDGSLWKTVGGTAEEVGKLAVDCLRAARCEVEWDGSGETAIKVTSW